MNASRQFRNVPAKDLFASQWLLAILLSLLGVASAYAQTSISQFSRSDRIELEKMIGAEAQRTVDRLQLLKSQRKPTKVTVKFDDTGRNLLVELGRGFIPVGPEYTPVGVMEQQRRLDIGIRTLLDEIISIEQIIFLYDGKDIFYYYPEDAPTRTKVTPATDVPPPGEEPGIPVGDTVVVSAGHGLYRLYDENRPLDYIWTEQRDLINGVQEDYLTPFYANELETWLEVRSDVTVKFPRSISDEVHIPSTTESETYNWWQVSARYYLEQLYPENTNIWNTHPNSLAPEREKWDDINSRPKYANHINSHALISLHTNAFEQPEVKGTRVYHVTGNTAGQQLGTSILCYMKEIIRAQDGYEDWTIQTSSTPSTNYGENNLADMQAVIVEIGFHTNPDDALAMQDSVFKTAAMKGLEKGYRLNEDGKPCEPFQIDNIPSATGPQNEPVPVKVHYKGYPQFAVKASMEILSCPSGWDCNDFEWNFPDNAPSPLTYAITCTVSSPKPAATFRVRTTLSDADGVTTAPVEHDFTCTPVTQSVPGTAPTGRPSIRIGPV